MQGKKQNNSSIPSRDELIGVKSHNVAALFVLEPSRCDIDCCRFDLTFAIFIWTGTFSQVKNHDSCLRTDDDLGAAKEVPS